MKDKSSYTKQKSIMVKTCSYIPIHFQLEGGVKGLKNAEWVKKI